MDNIAQRPVFQQNLTPPDLGEALRSRRALRRFFIYWGLHPLGGALDYALHYALRWIGNIDFCSSFGAALGRRAGRKSYDKYKTRAWRNLERLRPDIPAEARDATVLGMFDTIGRTMAEYSILDRLVSAGRVEIVGADHLTAAAADGRGIVVAGLHLGNWELIAPALSHLGYATKTFYEPPLNRFRHRLVTRSRERSGVVTLFPGRGTALRMMRELKSGVSCLIYLDERYRRVVYGPRLGRDMPLAGNIVIAARYAAMAGVDIVLAHCERIGGARFRVEFHPPVSPSPGPEDEDTDRLVAGLAERLDAKAGKLLTEHLPQWYYLGALELD